MSHPNTADQALVREINLSLVLRYVHNEAPVSRAQIAATTGLNKSTVSSLVDELLERRLIHEIGINAGGTGRPATLLEINPQAGGIIGIELGVDFVAVALTDFAGKIVWRKDTSADPSQTQDRVIAETLQLAGQAIAASRDRDLNILGLGVATPGTVDLKEGILIFAPNLHWRNVPLKKIYTENTGLKVFVENDANAAALGEHLFGAARRCTDFIFVFAGVGIGSGLFLNGQLYRGKNGYAGEIGHSPIIAGPTQAPCHCGNRGCWETYANQYSIIQRAQARLEVKRNSIIPRLMAEQGASLSIAIIKQAADEGDIEALESFAEAGTAMGQGFAALVNMFNPEKIFMGGPLSFAGKYMLPSIQQAILRHALPETSHQVEILLSSFGPDASLIGATSIVVHDILQNPTHAERR